MQSVIFTGIWINWMRHSSVFTRMEAWMRRLCLLGIMWIVVQKVRVSFRELSMVKLRAKTGSHLRATMTVCLSCLCNRRRNMTHICCWGWIGSMIALAGSPHLNPMVLKLNGVFHEPIRFTPRPWSMCLPRILRF